MQKFNYTPSNPFSGSVSSLAIGAGMVVVPLVYPFGIRIGRMRILGPTAVTIIFVIGGLVNESVLLSEVEYTKFDEEENEFKISLPADHHVIRGAFFENAEAFDAFKSIFDK